MFCNISLIYYVSAIIGQQLPLTCAEIFSLILLFYFPILEICFDDVMSRLMQLSSRAAWYEAIAKCNLA